MVVHRTEPDDWEVISVEDPMKFIRKIETIFYEGKTPENIVVDSVFAEFRSGVINTLGGTQRVFWAFNGDLSRPSNFRLPWEKEPRILNQQEYFESLFDKALPSLASIFKVLTRPYSPPPHLGGSPNYPASSQESRV